MVKKCFHQDWLIDTLDCLEGRLKALGINVSTDFYVWLIAQIWSM